jgi:hypothetical protein
MTDRLSNACLAVKTWRPSTSRKKSTNVVGRRNKMPDASKSGMKLQGLAVELHRSLRQPLGPKVVLPF